MYGAQYAEAPASPGRSRAGRRKTCASEVGPNPGSCAVFMPRWRGRLLQGVRCYHSPRTRNWQGSPKLETFKPRLYPLVSSWNSHKQYLL